MSYENLKRFLKRLTVGKGYDKLIYATKKIKLPAVPAITGYKNLGWSTQKNDTKAVYAAGKKIRLKKTKHKEEKL